MNHCCNIMPNKRYRSSFKKNCKTENICKLTSFRTYDEIPIRKIMVANIRSSTTHKELKKKFEFYGEIIDCNLKRKSMLKKSYAFIIFRDCISAQRAIRDGCSKKISIDGQYLRVLPAAAWNQPDRNNIPINLIDIEEKRLSAYNHYSSNNDSPISKLNEYCLLYIFGYLTIRDTIRIERVCRYWQSISRESLQLNYKKFDSILSYDNCEYIKNDLSLYKILEKFGSYITKVSDLNAFKFVSNSTLIAIAELCSNLEEINLLEFPFLASGIKALAKNCTKIKRITIGKSNHESYKNVYYDKELSALFLKNRNLQYLHFNGNVISGSCLKHLSSKCLTHIFLTEQNCSLFFQIISKIPNLFALDIHSCSSIDMLLQDQSFKLNATNIEKLTIVPSNVYINRNITDLDIIRAVKESTINDFFKCSNLKNLKYIDLRNFPLGYITDDFLVTLSENYSHQLVYINISGAKGLTNSGLISIITSLSKLEYLHMADMYESITSEIFCSGMPNLKTLDCSFCSGIQDEGLIKFINNSDKLEKLNVNNCPLITNKLIFAAIEYTKHRKNDIVLSVDALETKVNINIEDLKENSPFLEFRCRTGKTLSFYEE